MVRKAVVPDAGKPAEIEEKKRVKFDENEFFCHLRGNPDAGSALRLLRSIDKRACLEVVSYAIRYVRRYEEKPLELERSERGARIKPALGAASSALRKAAAKYAEVEAIEIPGVGSLVKTRAQGGLEGYPALADELKTEADRLSALLQRYTKLDNEKRMGVSGSHIWLVLLQEFVAAWTLRELGEARQIRPKEIAVLIRACRLSLRWHPERSEADPELISKAIRNFRSNPSNAWIAREGVKSYAAKRCDLISHRPYLLGIEI